MTNDRLIRDRPPRDYGAQGAGLQVGQQLRPEQPSARAAALGPCHLVRQAARWRPRNNRQIWLIVSSLVLVVCVEAIVIPAKRDGLSCAVTGLIGMGLLVTGHRRQRRERAALAARASEPRDGIPADVIGLVAAGQKIRAIKRYRELTGVELKEAKVIIDRL